MAVFHVAHRRFAAPLSQPSLSEAIRDDLRGRRRRSSSMAAHAQIPLQFRSQAPLARTSGGARLCSVLRAMRRKTPRPKRHPSPPDPAAWCSETHGAWQVSCRTPPGAKEEKCALVQSVTAEDRPNVGLTVVFYKAIGEDKKLLRVVVPLGVLLPTGLGLKIDGQDVGNAPFLKCGKRGCVAEVVLQDEVINKMKTGAHRHVHHLRHAGGRHRHPGQPARLRRCARQPEIAAILQA